MRKQRTLAGARGVASFQIGAVGGEVYRLLRDAGLHGGFGYGIAHFDEQAAVERLRNDVARAELERLVWIERLYLVRDVLSGKSGESVRGGGEAAPRRTASA